MEIPRTTGITTLELIDFQETLEFDGVDPLLRLNSRQIEASDYENEASVAAAVRRSGLPRDQLFLVTKIWFDDMGERTSEALQESLRLGVLEVASRGDGLTDC